MSVEAQFFLLVWGTLVGLDLVSVPQAMIARPLVAGAVGGWNCQLPPKAERKSRNACQLGGQPKAPQSKLLVNSVGPPSFPISKLRRWP